MLLASTTGTVMHKQLERFYTQIDGAMTMGMDYAADATTTSTKYEDLELRQVKEEPVTPTDDARSTAEDEVNTWPHVPRLTTGGDKYTLLPKDKVVGEIQGLYISPTDLKHTLDYVTRYITEHGQAEEGAIITTYMDSYEDYFTDIDQMVDQQTYHGRD